MEEQTMRFFAFLKNNSTGSGVEHFDPLAVAEIIGLELATVGNAIQELKSAGLIMAADAPSSYMQIASVQLLPFTSVWLTRRGLSTPLEKTKANEQNDKVDE